MEKKEKIRVLFIKNAVKEMKKRGEEALDYAQKLEKAEFDVEEDALIEAFEREFNHKFSKIEIRV